MKQIYILSVAALLLTSCNINRQRASWSFSEKAQQHKIVAVLPAKVMYTGAKPKAIKGNIYEDVRQSDEYLMQQSMYTALLHRTYTRNKRNRLIIQLQPAQVTNSILTSNGISDPHSISYDSLSRLLGVDAVLTASMVKRRIVSNGLSMSTGIADIVLSVAAKDSAGNNYKRANGIPTYNITVNYYLYDGKDGSLVWSELSGGNAFWPNNQQQVTEQCNNSMARIFPYRQKDYRNLK